MRLPAATVRSLANVPGLVHGFGRRLTSAAAAETREQTRRRVSESLSTSGRLFLLKQVHGATVARAPWEGTLEADAGVALQPGLLIGIETADCLPVLIVDPRRRQVAAAHAGWRGAAAGVAVRAVEALVASGSRAEDLLVALGPCIGPCCYEVGEDVQAAFTPGDAAAFAAGPRGLAHLDLQAASTLQLLRAGIGEGSISRIDECTRCRAELYHSYRRDGRGAGRMLNYVGFARES